MKKNINYPERVIRCVSGTLLLAWGFAGGPLWCFAGFYPLVTGIWGQCLIYLFVKPRIKE